MEHLGDLHILRIQAVRDAFEKAALLVLLLLRVDPCEEAAIRAVRRPAGRAGGPLPELLEEPHRGRRFRAQGGLHCLRRDVEETNEATTGIFPHRYDAGGVGQHEVDADHPRKWAIRRPLRLWAAPFVALGKLWGRRQFAVAMAHDDVGQFLRTPDGVARYCLVHATRRFRLLAAFTIIRPRTDPETVAVTLGPIWPLAGRRQLWARPLVHRAVQPARGLGVALYRRQSLGMGLRSSQFGALRLPIVAARLWLHASLQGVSDTRASPDRERRVTPGHRSLSHL
mmetsp:Transcript_108591/g.312856  ORF Transcript_108591/g.312856 Transcript_108591/m.312856 type:complete len:283 (-) Transcript_108591:282-1130(-)